MGTERNCFITTRLWVAVSSIIPPPSANTLVERTWGGGGRVPISPPVASTDTNFKSQPRLASSDSTPAHFGVPPIQPTERGCMSRTQTCHLPMKVRLQFFLWCFTTSLVKLSLFGSSLGFFGWLLVCSFSTQLGTYEAKRKPRELNAGHALGPQPVFFSSTFQSYVLYKISKAVFSGKNRYKTLPSSHKRM